MITDYTNSSLVIKGGMQLPSKNKDSKKYQVFFGIIEIECHMYRPLKGGKVFYLLQDSAHVIFLAIPKFVQQLSYKHS